jgi:hypothetical protein
MAQPPHGSPEDERVDEAAAESFPASDAPSWSAMHAGGPSSRPLAPEHGRELRAALRADVERFARAAHNATEATAEGRLPAAPPQSHDVASRAMLDAGRAIVREPVDEELSTWNVEAEQLGTEPAAPSLIVGARCLESDASGAAMLLALLRAASSARLRRTVRFVLFAGATGSARFLERLDVEGASVCAMLSLARLDLARARRTDHVLFVGSVRSASVARTARDTFRASSRIPARSLVLPSWVPGVASSDHAVFLRRGLPAVMVADAAPWRIGHSTDVPDVDRMAAAVPGLVAVIVRLAGGRV